MKRAKRFSLIVQHYGEQAQPLEEGIDRARADRVLIARARQVWDVAASAYAQSERAGYA